MVEVGGCQSYIDHVTSGFPQGSIIGPLLYVLTVGVAFKEHEDAALARADEIGQKMRLYHYADDVKIVYSFENVDEMDNVQELVKKLEVEGKKLGLKFNPLKSCLMKFGTGHYTESINLNEQTIPEEGSFRDLGCIISKTYTFVLNMESQMMKAKRVINIVKYSLKIRDETSMKMVYLMYFQPVLLYCSEVCYEQEIEKHQ